MKAREIVEHVHWLGAVDWDRRLFDSLIPLPDGTSYNAYLIEGTEKTALLDTVAPGRWWSIWSVRSPSGVSECISLTWR